MNTDIADSLKQAKEQGITFSKVIRLPAPLNQLLFGCDFLPDEGQACHVVDIDVCVSRGWKWWELRDPDNSSLLEFSKQKFEVYGAVFLSTGIFLIVKRVNGGIPYFADWEFIKANQYSLNAELFKLKKKEKSAGKKEEGSFER